jgi:hypothetical protein
VCSSVYEIEGPEEIKDRHFQISAVCFMPPCTLVLGYQLAKRTYCVPLQGIFGNTSCEVAPRGAELHRSRDE